MLPALVPQTHLQVLSALLQLLCERLHIQVGFAHFQVSRCQLCAQLLQRLLMLLLQLLAAVQCSLMIGLQGLVLVMVQLLKLLLQAVPLTLQLQQQQFSICAAVHH